MRLCELLVFLTETGGQVKKTSMAALGKAGEAAHGTHSGGLGRTRQGVEE